MTYQELIDNVHRRLEISISSATAGKIVKHQKLPKSFVKKIVDGIRNEMLLCARRGEEFEWKGLMMMYYRPMGRGNPLDPYGKPHKKPRDGVWVQLKAGTYLKRAAGHGREQRKRFMKSTMNGGDSSVKKS